MIQYNFSLPMIDEFFLYLQTNNYSPATVSGYKSELAMFDGFLQKRFLRFNLLNKKALFDFKVYLYSDDRRTPTTDEVVRGKLSTASINRCISSVRSYLRFLIDQDYPTPIVPDMIRGLRKDRPHPHVAEFKDLVALIELPTEIERKPEAGLRNRAVLEMLFATGLRISELINLNRIDINDEGKIFVMGKGRKERFVYLTERAKLHLKNYLDIRTDKHPALFVSLNADERITQRHIQESMRFYRAHLKINVRITPHSLRHGFATYLAEQGAPAAAIQVLLGHESLETTTRYINISDQFAQETHRKFHPLAF